MLVLRGIPFRPVLTASGAFNFFGEGWRHHALYPLLGLHREWIRKNTTFVAKTTTALPRAGNMPLRENSTTPKEFFPKCIVVKMKEDSVLNAVGLSGHGLEWLLEQHEWQERTDPFFVSFMPAHDPARPMSFDDQVRFFVDKISEAMPPPIPPFGIQFNLSCPNTGEKQGVFMNEATRWLNMLARLNVPIVPKFNALAPIESIMRIAEHDACDAVSISNTIPWGADPRIPWKQVFGSDTSPLAEFGGGGYSGKYLFPITVEAVKNLLDAGYTKPLIAGGGILSPRDAWDLIFAGGGDNYGADAIELGTIFIVRPYHARDTIREATVAFEMRNDLQGILQRSRHTLAEKMKGIGGES